VGESRERGGGTTVLIGTPGDLSTYASIPIRFRVDRRFRVVTDGRDEMVLREVPVEPPFIKDYDAEPGHHPTSWPERFDMSRWAELAAVVGGERVGGAIVAFGSPDVDMLEGRNDLAVLWDIRVRPDGRGNGIGTALLEAAARWAKARGCTELKIETQDLNYRACRFYAACGCELRGVELDAYPELPDEALLLWYLDLSHTRWGASP